MDNVVSRREGEGVGSTILKEVSSQKGKGRKGQKYQIQYGEREKGKKNVGNKHVIEEPLKPGRMDPKKRAIFHLYRVDHECPQ